MKLPENKKERVLVLSLIGVVTLIMVFAIIQWGLLPLLDSRRNMETELVRQGDQMKKARRELDYAPAIRKEYDDAMTQLEAIRKENVLHSILGSYLVGVTEQVETTARATGVQIEDVREIGVTDIPINIKTAAPRVFKSFAVQVSGQGTFDGISRFLLQMEERNPYFFVSDILISGQADAPELQRLSVRMEWPIEPAPAKTGGGS